jgi:vacuolar protein sorting-associated protein 13A/C
VGEEEGAATHRAEFGRFGITAITYRWAGRKAQLWAASFPDGAEPVLLLTNRTTVARSVRDMAGLMPLEGASRSLRSLGRSKSTFKDEKASSAAAAAAAGAKDAPHIADVQTHAVFVLKGVGISLVDAQPREVAYLSVNGREVWEHMLPTQNQWGEDWLRFGIGAEAKLNALRDAPTPPEELTVAPGTRVNLQDMTLRFEDREPLAVRLHHHPGFSLAFIDCKRQTLVRIVTEDVQLDNQLEDPYVPVILSKSSPSQSSIPNMPLLKLLYVQNKMEVDAAPAMGGVAPAAGAAGPAAGAQVQAPAVPVLMIDRFSLLLQKIDLSVSDRWLLALLGVIDTKAASSGTLAVDISGDLKWIRKQTLEETLADLPSAARVSCRQLELHPLAINLKVTPVFEDDGDSLASDNVLMAFLRAVGVSLVKIDVPFTLKALILRNVFSPQSELSGQIVSHYVSAGIAQAYKVVLGFDFLGNPNKLFDHLTTGVSALYYEPFLEGIQSMASNTVAGAVGVVTSITGTLGNSFAALAMDDDYKRARQRAAAKQRTAVGELSHGGQQLFRGMLEGATGLVLQPFRGAQEEGAVGFFKGVGKGVLGLIAKPVAGVIDMTTSTVDLIRRAAHNEKVAQQMRLTRHVRPDKILRAYSAYEAEGAALLRSVSLSTRELAEDVYVMHYVLEPPKRSKKRLIGTWRSGHGEGRAEGPSRVFQREKAIAFCLFVGVVERGAPPVILVRSLFFFFVRSHLYKP